MTVQSCLYDRTVNISPGRSILRRRDRFHSGELPGPKTRLWGYHSGSLNSDLSATHERIPGRVSFATNWSGEFYRPKVGNMDQRALVPKPLVQSDVRAHGDHGSTVVTALHTSS